MTQTKHTPGPWVWDYLESPYGILSGSSGEMVFDTCRYEGMWFASYDNERDKANAHLIAAAPEMLEALVWVWQNAMSAERGEIQASVEAIIAKAKGEA